MNRRYKDCIITYGLMGICIIVYLYTTLRYGIEMSAMEGIEVGGFNPFLFIIIMNIFVLLQQILFILV